MQGLTVRSLMACRSFRGAKAFGQPFRTKSTASSAVDDVTANSLRTGNSEDAWNTTLSSPRHSNEYLDRQDAAEGARRMGGISASVRHDWTKAEIGAVYNQPFHELMYHAGTVHRMYWDPSEVQQCTLLSIKTGGCTEDCKLCLWGISNL